MAGEPVRLPFPMLRAVPSGPLPGAVSTVEILADGTVEHRATCVRCGFPMRRRESAEASGGFTTWMHDGLGRRGTCVR